MLWRTWRAEGANPDTAQTFCPDFGSPEALRLRLIR
jgi:hypothetical protein